MKSRNESEMNSLVKLSDWFSENCNGEWEHTYGVSIETLDNPGWAVRIDVRELELSQREFPPIQIDRGDFDWLNCKVENEVFVGFGGPCNLDEILDVFLNWAVANKAGA